MDPLRFEPLFQQYLWGGRRLGTILGKPLGDAPRYAESWEVVDHGEDQSVVAAGPLAGRSLRELMVEHRDALLGVHRHQHEVFPLLFKFLDAQQVLSLQVHPNDVQAAQLTPPDLGKTEAWVILDAAPDAIVYCGLKPGVGERELQQALAAGEAADCIHQFQPTAGDCVFVPAGVPHALGAGLLVAEIQQASNTTFRLHDWNRVDSEGRSRPLHIDQGLAVIDFDCGPVDPVQPVAVAPQRERLVACDKFVLDRLRLAEPEEIGGDSRFHILTVLEGAMTLRWHNGEMSMPLGQTVLTPADVKVELTAESGSSTVALDMYLP